MNRQEAQELLPWFVNGTLSEDESRAVQAFIDTGEIKTSEIDELALFAETICEQDSHEPAYDPKILQNAMAQLDDVVQETADEPLLVRESLQQKPEKPSLLQRLIDAMQWQQTPTLARAALGAQFAAVLALAVFVAMPLDRADDGQPGSYQVVAGAAPAADFTIAFASGTSEMALRELLVSLDALIVDGPNSLGMYHIAITEESNLADIQQKLQNSALTTYVQPAAQQ